MAKVILDDISTTLANSAASTLNNNNTKLEAALEKTLSRDGTGPNHMEADFDLNHNDILNVDNIHASVLVLNGTTVTPVDLANIPATVMMKPVYDPTGVEGDVFDRRNWGEFSTKEELAAREVPALVQQVNVGSGYSFRHMVRVATPSPVEAWHTQSLDGSWWEIRTQWLTPQMFGAVGDDVADDYPAIQLTLDAASALNTNVYFPTGTYRLSTGSPEYFSDVVIRGNGKGRSILHQPNYYSYNRPTDPYVKENVVDWNALWGATGVQNVEVAGIDFRGPFWQPDDAGYAANPVESWPANNGFHIRGADYEFRKGLPISHTESINIKVHSCHFEGWAEDAIQTDYATEVWIFNNSATHCARGGHRGYSTVHCWTQFNSIETLSPGDYLNNGNRMYGVEFTRQYIAGVRPSADCWVTNNRIRDCLQWKGMGTHGGQRINFMYNDIFDCHHGVGIDKGGFTVDHGISPPRDIKIIGNRFLRTAPGSVTEGNGEGGAGHALFVVAHDTTATHMGKNVVIADNIIEGWGCENLNGGAWIGNWDGVVMHDNIFRDNFGTAIRFRDKVTGLNLGPNSFIGVTRSAAGNHRAIGFENAEAYGTVGPQYFENTDGVNTMTAIFLSNHAAGQGLTIADGHRYVGLVSKCNISLNALASPFNLVPAAAGYVTVGAGGPATLTNASGIASAVWESTGVVLITIERAATLANNLFAIPSIVGAGGRTVNWERVGTTQIRVRTFAAGGAVATDNSFAIAIWAF